jgi:hypothetical protein
LKRIVAGPAGDRRRAADCLDGTRTYTMSEYQYYEFQAVDRPLTERQIGELRRYSTRATITATRFVNHYEWGGLKGDPSVWMQKYFDAFLYVANWGTHELMLRFPRRVLDLATAKRYCCGQLVSAKNRGDFVILDFLSNDEEGDGWDDDGSGWLSALIPLRAEIAGGDHRALYIAWLGCVQEQALENKKLGPPVPPGLGKLTAAQKAFADFLRIDADLIAVASTHSSKAQHGPSRKAVERCVARLPDSQKAQWVTRMALGDDSHVRAEIQRLFQQGSRGRHSGGDNHLRVGDLLAAAETRREEQRRYTLERAARAKAQRERLEALARERYLRNLAKREPAVWRQVETLIATRRPADYDQAAKLLADLRDVGIRQDRAGQIDAQIRRLCERHAKKESLLSRLRRAGLPQDLLQTVDR